MKSMCNKCAKFLTCNRKECNQVTYLQANQIERLEAKKSVEAEGIENEHRRTL